MNKKTLKKVLMRGGLATISLSLALVGAYLLTPSKTRVVNLGGNSFVRPQTDDQETYFTAFVNRLKDASDADSEESIPGLKASLEGFGLTWGGLQEGSSALKNDIKIGERCHPLFDGVFEVLNGFLVLFSDKIPFIDNNKHSLLILLNHLENIDVLPFNASGSIYHKYTYISVFNSSNRPHYRIVLKILVNFILLSNSCRVNKIEIETKLIVFSVNRISCSPGNISNHIPIIVEKSIY